MNRTVLIEGILLLVISLVSAAEGLRLILQKDPKMVYDLIGPGSYILFLSIALMATGIAYLFVNYRKVLSIDKVVVNKGMGIRMISMVVVFVIYILLIDTVGYPVATVVFFLLEFRIVGIKSWPTNIILTLVFTVIYYIVFVQYCNLIFPRGIFFR